MYLIIPRQSGKTVNRKMMNEARDIAKERGISLMDAILYISSRELLKPRKTIKCEKRGKVVNIKR